MPSATDEVASLANMHPSAAPTPPSPGASSTHLLVEGLLPGQVGLLGWQAAQRGFLTRQGGHEALWERGGGCQRGWGTHSARRAEVKAHSLRQASPLPCHWQHRPRKAPRAGDHPILSPPVPKKGPVWQRVLTCMP